VLFNQILIKLIIDFVITRLFIKLFKTNNMYIVKYCQFCVSFKVPNKLWVITLRPNNLNQKISKCDNVCH